VNEGSGVRLPRGATGATRVGGGYINEGWRVTLADGRDAFVKTRADAGAGEYAREAEGLGWLARAGALRTPEVLEVDEGYLALAWVEGGSLSEAGAEELGRGLAATHAAGAPAFGDPGAIELCRFGPLSLPNEPAPDWPAFYAQRRLEPLARLARDHGALTPAVASLVERVAGRLDELAGAPEPPARLHGDLWSGNVMAGADGRPWLIDPASYGGHREVDLAMLRLFGAPSERVFDAYDEAQPLADGWRERVMLYQLLPLLVHALLFGGSYAGSVEQAARRYAG
jgi:fructosamine-3-kinase